LRGALCLAGAPTTQVELLGSVLRIELTDVDAVLAVNQRFYDAFEARDLDAMSDVWEHSERAVCTHPGWPILRGWASISASWFSLFSGPQRLQFILTGVTAEVVGDLAYVTLDENLLSSEVSGTVATIQLFARQADGTWRMVVHHGSPVAA